MIHECIEFGPLTDSFIKVRLDTTKAPVVFT